MKAHLANQITLNQLAQISQLSPSYFLRAFQAEYHATPHQMLMALRLFEAKCLLAKLATNLLTNMLHKPTQQTSIFRMLYWLFTQNYLHAP